MKNSFKKLCKYCKMKLYAEYVYGFVYVLSNL